jgi:predicted 3-demethylubiquinone-9 3-methyltransferase (glyoxalase superfamily)
VALSVTPFLMFAGDAEEAMTLYASLFEGGQILDLQRYGPEGPGMNGDVMSGLISVAGQTIMCVDSAVKHAFTFTPATSLFAICETEEEIDRAWATLVVGGQIMMPLAPYPFAPKFGWVQDKYGVSWQLSLAG